MKCNYDKGIGGIVVRDAYTCLRVELTLVYRSMARPSTDANARAIVSALHRFWVEARRRELDYNATFDQVRAIVDHILTQHYKAEVSGVSIRRVHATGNATTVQSFLQALRRGFELLIELGQRTTKNPLVRYRGARGDLQRHQHVARYGGEISNMGLLGSYQVHGPRAIPPEVVDGTVIPDAVREAFERVNAAARDLSYFESLTSTGARNSEIGSATFASFADGFGHTLHLRDKGKGLLASKVVSWDDRARAAYLDYFCGERLHHDQLGPGYLKWAGRRNITIDLYIQFLRCKGIDLATVPLYLTQTGSAYSGDTFRHEIWHRAKQTLTKPYRPHHLRHVHVCRRLQVIWEAFGSTPHLYVEALIDFVAEMGWSSWTSLRHYDAKGLAVHALTDHYSAKRKGSRVADHGDVGKQFVAANHDPEIHARTRPKAS